MAQASAASLTIREPGRPVLFRIEPGVSAVCDPDLLRVVLDNLLGNAVKYGREGTEVLVSVRRDGVRLRVEVRNAGVGVAPDKIPSLFQKFYRIHDPALMAAKGTGVGLYLVRRFVELHGGRVGVEGEYGKWITFWFEISAGG